MNASGLILALYGSLWCALRPLLRRNHRLADGFAQRLAPAGWAEPHALWLQAASGGEAYLAATLVRELAERPLGANASVLLTTWTRQGFDVLEALRAELASSRPAMRVSVRFVPFDAPKLMHRAIAMVRPKVLVLLETELWPGLLHACAQAGVPVCVCNARLQAKNLRAYTWLAPFWRRLAPHTVLAISAEDAARFAKAFPASQVRCAGNIKFDRAALGIHQSPDPAKLEDVRAVLRPGAVRLVLASVREEEETLLLPLVASLVAGSKARGQSLQVVVAPRHMHRVAAWQQGLMGVGLETALRSGPHEAAHKADVLVWDAFGELAALYGEAHAVFVGGSLAPLGGQNFLEPLALGLVPCVGPSLHNFAWALDGLAVAGLLQICPDVQTLERDLNTQLAALAADQGAAARQAVRQRFAQWLAPRLGSTARQAEVVESFLERAN